MLDQELENKEVAEEKEAEQADVNDLLPSGSPIEKPAEDARDYAEVIEEARQVFWKKYKTGCNHDLWIVRPMQGSVVPSLRPAD